MKVLGDLRLQDSMKGFQNNIHPIFDKLVSRQEQERLLNQKGQVLWFTGLSGSGKSTIAEGLERELYTKGYFVKVLDGDNIRSGINKNLGFSLDLQKNITQLHQNPQTALQLQLFA